MARQRNGMHFGSPESSERMKKLLGAFQARAGAGITTWEFQTLASVCEGSTAASELRNYLLNAGIPWTISKTYEGKSDNGRKIYRYFLVHALTGASYTEGAMA